MKKSTTQYLSKEDIRIIHTFLSEKFEKAGEPIPAFSLAKQNEIDALVHLPQNSFFGVEVYPTIIEKAAIVFYSINKKQIFANGNKRMSTACLVVFLVINDIQLDVTPDGLTRKALELAKTDSRDFQEVKEDLFKWLSENTSKIEHNT